MAEHTMDELRLKAVICEGRGPTLVYDAGVVKSDCAVPEDLRTSLVLAVQSLEDVSETQKDWHPGSDDKVLDLVHPSLFPLVWGRSRILTDSVANLEDFVAKCGEGSIRPEGLSVEPPAGLEGSQHQDQIPIGIEKAERGMYSRQFQWLPCDVQLTPAGSAR